ncbi:MAG: DUF2239 family protein [Polaromonas sp.]|nr:DUF2239 family protein [Polaromonas sp.]
MTSPLDQAQAPASERLCTAFEESRRIATGSVREVALKVKTVMDQPGHHAVLVFDNATSELIEFDLRGSSQDVLDRLPAASAPENKPVIGENAPQTARGPGRPRLGVVAREVTLLPRHWDWLAGQPGGASVALRKLVEEARRSHEGKDRVRLAQEAGYRFMSSIAGHQAHFEEASRALFAGHAENFRALTAQWPSDVREHALTLLAPAFDSKRARD